jgi:formate dehydrogenase subunit delta
MSPDAKLVYMANQIATFFASQPEAERVDGVAAHLKDFWTPDMRARLIEIIDGGASGPLPLVVAASERLRRHPGADPVETRAAEESPPNPRAAWEVHKSPEGTVK